MGAGWIGRGVGAIAVAIALVSAPVSDASARGRPKVVWTDIRIPQGEDAASLEKFLRQVVERETRRARWGESNDGPIEVELRVTDLAAVVTGDVVRVTCAGVGKLHGGGSARSKFSMGAHVHQRTQLEKQLLTMLGRGIVTRLADMSRARR
jgi:hypothetical protein